MRSVTAAPDGDAVAVRSPGRRRGVDGPAAAGSVGLPGVADDRDGGGDR